MGTFRSLPFVLLACAALLLASCGDPEEKHEQSPTVPKVSGVTPDNGPLAGGNTVTVYGVLFTDPPTVTFGGAAATNVTFVSAGEITCDVPAGAAAGAVDVAVSGVTLAGGYTYGEWWDDNWTRRVAISVTGSAADLTGYQVQVDLTYDDDMQADFSDLRFTGIDASGLETYAPSWLETQTASTSATFWVRAPHIPGGGTGTLYAYYGNPTAPSGSDFDATFDKDYGETGLLGLWHMDDASGVFATDETAYQNHGVLEGFITPFGWTSDDGGAWGGRTDVGFSSGSALAFDGETAWVDCGAGSGALDPSTAFTLSAWVRGIDSTLNGGEQVVSGKWQSQGSNFTDVKYWDAYDPGGAGWVGHTGLTTAREGLAAAGAYDMFFIFGGWTGSAVTTVSMFNPLTGGWSNPTSLPSPGRYDFAAATIDDKIYLAGGYDGTNELDDFVVYDYGTNTWTTLADMPAVRRSPGVAAWGGKIYVAGGADATQPRDTLWEYDPETDAWTALASMSLGRYRHGCAALDGKVYVAGGSSFLSSYLDSVEVFDIAAGTWSSGTALGEARRQAALVATGGYLLCIGGYGDTSGYLNDVDRYDPAGGSWTGLTATLPTPRRNFGAAVLDGRVYTIGGYNSGYQTELESFAYGFETETSYNFEGYNGASFDGRYVYYSPMKNTTGTNHNFLRYDTHKEYHDLASWAYYRPADAGVGASVGGYAGIVFDGRYLYYVPSSDNGTPFGQVLRYDTQGAFDAAASWTAYDPGAAGVGVEPDGYGGGCFDGRYVIFIPAMNASGYHGEFLRYDTQADFSTATSWTAYDPGAAGVGSISEGYGDSIFDGRYLYAIPANSTSGRHGEFMRYDTRAPFTAAASWRAFDPGSAGVGVDPDGYFGGFFDGRYAYFAPWDNGSGAHSEMLRFDTTQPFEAASSWTAFDPVLAGVGSGQGFHMAVFDGRYGYFLPRTHTEVFRYDTTRLFTSTTAWSVVSPDSWGLGHTYGTPYDFAGGVFDGRYVHMVAWEHGPPHGEMVRFDTAGEDTAFKLLYSRMDPAGGRSGMGYGFQALVNTRTGHRSVFSNTQPAPDTWHHVAMTYDGTALSLYVNGALAGSTPGAGAVNPTWLPLAMGAAGDGTGHFQGQIDEMRLHSRALAAEEVLAQAQRRKYASPEPVAGAPGAEETR